MYKPANASLNNAEVTAELNASVDHAHLYAEYQRLAAEQAALRRLATLVGRGVEPPKVFDAVANEMRQCMRAEIACLWRYETADEITLIGASYHSGSLLKWPVGTRTPFAGDTLAEVLQRTGRPARMDSYDDAAGALAARIRAAGIRETVGVPIIVDGRIWGLATVGSTQSRVLPSDTEAHIGSFAELVATAVVAGYRDEQKRQILGGASRRPLMIDSLLQGQVLDDWSLWEVANCLRLPRNGPFVVLAAEVSHRVTEALTDIEPKLRSIDVYSAWRLLPDVQVGILHIASDERQRCWPGRRRFWGADRGGRQDGAIKYRNRRRTFGVASHHHLGEMQSFWRVAKIAEACADADALGRHPGHEGQDLVEPLVGRDMQNPNLYIGQQPPR